MLKRLALVALLSVSTPIVANAQGFISGLAVGGMLFGGSNHYGGPAATILYSANDDTLKQVDPLAIRMAAFESCFNRAYGNNATGLSVGELFAALMKGAEHKNRTILQIARVFHASNSTCASTWFSYTEK